MEIHYLENSNYNEELNYSDLFLFYMYLHKTIYTYPTTLVTASSHSTTLFRINYAQYKIYLMSIVEHVD